MKTSATSTIRLAIAVPLCASLALLVAARLLQRRTEANLRECAVCRQSAESIAPYLAEVQAYEAAKAGLDGALTTAKAPEPPMGVPPAERATERGTAIDGFVSVRETFSWQSLKTGQAFAVLESFASASPWRMAALRLRTLPDGENSSLSVTLECVEADGRRE